jgi:hypothetical protein
MRPTKGRLFALKGKGFRPQVNVGLTDQPFLAEK